MAQTYAGSMRVLPPKFEVYRKAGFLFTGLNLTNKLVAHAIKSEPTRGKVEGLFNETSDPGFLLILSGWKRILFADIGNEAITRGPSARFP
ncbi:hypothetical protein SAMN06298226_0121 [Nitrosovibrio sp. Nv4]|nr:hypothetical protein SAMN06298226_0121 [Nitrosovibrio sp. Nv4]